MPIINIVSTNLQEKRHFTEQNNFPTDSISGKTAAKFEVDSKQSKFLEICIRNTKEKRFQKIRAIFCNIIGIE